MTYPQFKLALEGIGEKLNWNIKLSIVASDPQGITTFKDKDFPMHPQSQVDENKRFTMKEAMAMVNMANGVKQG